jgi:hypothetical protein
MDPISAFAFAGTVIQLISFTSNIVSAARQIHNSTTGQLASHEDLQSITESLKKLAVNTKANVQQTEDRPNLTELERGQIALSDGCTEVASELLAVLETLKIEEKKGKSAAFRKAFQSLLKEDKIMLLEVRLQKFTQQLILSLVDSLRSVVVTKNEE